MNISNLKTGSKFQLLEDFLIHQTNWRGENRDFNYPKGLVISLVNLTINSSGRTLRFKVIRAKPIIEHFYQDIEVSAYKPEGSKERSWYYNLWETVVLYNKDFDNFVEAVNKNKIISFDKEYNKLTKAKVNE